MVKWTSFIILLLIAFQTVLAQTIELPLSEKIIARADFYQGDEDKPAVLILHGFLLTKDFNTVRNLAESLNDSGYTVLTPNLSLNISYRKHSLACEALHLHKLDEDIAELDRWVKWLEKKTRKNIVLIGHSSGSVFSSVYLARYQPEQIHKVIFLSMPHFGPAVYAYETAVMAEKARALVAAGDRQIHDFGLSYCKKYPTTAENFLSYYQLSQDFIDATLNQIRIRKLLIIGEKDKRIDKKWNQGLSQVDKIVAIKGANHFFDDEHEFDLFDEVEKLLLQ